MFLLAANRMSRGYAKLRQCLIMLFRVLAIAGLIFAVSRPLAERLARTRRRRPARHHDHSARSLAEHAATERRIGRDRSSMRAGISSRTRWRRSAPALGADRKHGQRAARNRVAAGPLKLP